MPIQPDPVLGHAANFLYMLTGERPSGLATRAFDVALILHADHELNASTFAARVAAATLTDIHSAIVGAIGALKGPLHGGANADVMRLLLEIGPDAPARAKPRKSCAPSWRGRKRFRASAIACTTPRIRARRTCARCRRTWASAPATADLVRDVAAHRGARQGGEEAEPERRFLFGVHVSRRSASPSICSRRSSPSAASPAGPRTCSSSTRNNRLIRPRAEYIGPEYPQRYVMPVEAR